MEVKACEAMIKGGLGKATDILREYGSDYNAEEWKGVCGEGTTYKLRKPDGQTAYVIKKYGHLKMKEEPKQLDRALVEWSRYDLLAKHTRYVGRVIGPKPGKEIFENDDPARIRASGLMLECPGLDLMSYRAKEEIKGEQLIDVIFQSAIALATAHTYGIYHEYVRPMNLIYNGKELRLINFDVPLGKIKASLTKEDCALLSSQSKGEDPTYIPPEILYYDFSMRPTIITKAQRDVFCWGMSILQFVTGKSDDAIREFSYPRIRTSTAEFDTLDGIKNIEVPELGKKVSHCLMTLIQKCLRIIPGERPSMMDVLMNLLNANGDCYEIFNSLSEEKKELYSSEIFDMLEQLNELSNITSGLKALQERLLKRDYKPVSKGLEDKKKDEKNEIIE